MDGRRLEAGGCHITGVYTKPHRGLSDVIVVAVRIFTGIESAAPKWDLSINIYNLHTQCRGGSDHVNLITSSSPLSK